MSRLRADFWVSAHLRRLAVEGVPAVQRRRGSPEAGAIFIKVDRLDGTADLYGPAPQALIEADDGERRFSAMLKCADSPDVEARIAKEVRFDEDSGSSRSTTATAATASNWWSDRDQTVCRTRAGKMMFRDEIRSAA